MRSSHILVNLCVALLLTFALLPPNGFLLRADDRPVGSADVALLNGNIFTMDEKQPRAQAIALAGERIIAVGSNEEVNKYVGPSTQVLDMKGLFLIPGFIEGHAHLLGLGELKMRIDLSKARNWDEIVSMVVERVRDAGPGEWVLGERWHQEKWDRLPASTVEGYPTDEALNSVSGETPVLLYHASGHALLANAKARALAGITSATQSSPGGQILKDAGGAPTGMLTDKAMELVEKAYRKSLAGQSPEQIEARFRDAVRLAVKECLSRGITSFQDASASFESIDLYKKMADGSDLGIRLWVMIHEDNEKLARDIARYRMIGYANNRLTVRAVKKFMDGALGSRTAWLLQPYSDLPTSTGLSVDSTTEVMETARLAQKHGFQLCVHAIGDRANREALNIYETVFKEASSGNGLRWRIEHAQHLSAADIPRFGQLGVIASMQTLHCTSDGPWVIKRLGPERAREGAYAWQKLIRTGAVVTNGTDAPVEDPDPIAGFHAAVTRKLPDGSAFFPDQCMSREEALRSCTLHSAFAAFEESEKGSLAPGKLADITVLSDDITAVPEEGIREIRVVSTIVGGRVVYKR